MRPEVWERRLFRLWRGLGLLGHMIGRQVDGAEGKPDRLLLYIDQWEELYTQTPSNSDKKGTAQHATDVIRFIDVLLTAARTASVTVVATVRADFHDPLIGHQQLASLLRVQQLTLTGLSRAELQRTIPEPARVIGLSFDPPRFVEGILMAPRSISLAIRTISSSISVPIVGLPGARRARDPSNLRATSLRPPQDGVWQSGSRHLAQGLAAQWTADFAERYSISV
jgi:hypothetical protein